LTALNLALANTKRRLSLKKVKYQFPNHSENTLIFQHYQFRRSKNMDALEKKTLKVSRGFSYTYYTSPAQHDLPTVLLCHGWPDSAGLFEGVINNYLKPAGYGVVAPDMLGYGGTSKPTNYQAYNFQHMSQDIVDILDHEGIDKVVSLGHDWGCFFAQRLYNFHADRVIGLVMINVSYHAPSPEPFNLDKALELTTKLYGYGTFVSGSLGFSHREVLLTTSEWYWKLFGSDDGYKLLNSRIESMFTLAHAKPETWLKTLCKADGAKHYLEEDRRQPVEVYATDEMREHFIARMKRDSFEGPQQWYRAMVNGEQDIADKSVPKDNIAVHVPTLFFGGARDMAARPENLGPSQKAGLLPHLKIVTVDAGHWALLAKPTEFGEALSGWLKENF
jgi:pimeloyl-ACP methyl ester carboxylesterase